MYIHVGYILMQWIRQAKTSLKIYLSLYCKVCVWEGSRRLIKACNILTPTLMAISVVSFLFSSADQPETRGLSFLLSAGFLYHILSPTGLQTKLGVLRAPSAEWWLSLPHLVSNSSDLWLTDFLSHRVI